MQKELLDDENIFVIHNFLSEEECDALVQRSEGIGYEEATITTAAGFVMNKSVRDNDRVLLDDEDLANAWWERAKELLPPYRHREPIGLNERFRFYRYDPTQKFALHTDGFFRRDNGEQSNLTFMVYLNDDFEGGATNFYVRDGRLRTTIAPEKGTALVFVHYQLHEGAPVESGRKYVLRTDVMYGVPE